MRLGRIFKSSLRLITTFVPNAVLAKIATEIAIWAVESLVRNSKTTIDDKGLEIIKKVIKKSKKKNAKV